MACKSGFSSKRSIILIIQQIKKKNSQNIVPHALQSISGWCSRCGRSFERFSNGLPVVHNIIFSQHIYNIRSRNGNRFFFAWPTYFTCSCVCTPVSPRYVDVMSIFLELTNFLHELLVNMIHGKLLLALEFFGKTKLAQDYKI